MVDHIDDVTYTVRNDGQHTVKVWRMEILVDSSQNCQSVKINSPPKFPAIQYF